ncbi:hypothetical protein S40285_07208 [Stachybotrys chlorohalonatus IBT 40285]|uniref:Transcription factor domain-containing protein n=1 Tax=Stachybotrys chlorohalonatus (strain IBT 40285) TaxID=1283841 RepID=A0A084QWH2_STAC4|nr:hypothetical protein S40285_07208 [Stachybotrys chlorohalonata IBT 40285]
MPKGCEAIPPFQPAVGARSWGFNASVKQMFGFDKLPFRVLAAQVQGSAGNELLPRSASSASSVDLVLGPRNRQEARLIRHFIDHLAPAFDLCDPLCHFACVVPVRARSCLALLYAVLAVSARSLSISEKIDAVLVEDYHQKCLSVLIPLLSNGVSCTDENLLAAVVILRCSEQMKGSYAEEHGASHLTGIHALLEAQRQFIGSGGLRQAAFWVALRQEVGMAIQCQRPITSVIDRFPIELSLDPADDSTWANRMVLLTAKLTQHCCSKRPTTSTDGVYEHLATYADRWMEMKPASFEPFYFQSANDDSLFPELWLTCDAHVMGLLYYHLAKILLEIYRPDHPQLESAVSEALNTTDATTREHVLTLSGIAMTIPRFHVAHLTACGGIILAAGTFPKRSEQVQLLEVMSKAAEVWNIKETREKLYEAWGWK